MPVRRAVLTAAIALPLAWAAPAAAPAAERLTVFAAASLMGVLGDLAAGFAERTGAGSAPPALVLAGSATLARQIEAGAPADIFVSANAAWMDRLEAAGLIVPETRTDIAANALVLVAPTESAADAPPAVLGPDTDLAARLGDGRLAVALTEAVPAGIYARAALATLGLWQDVADRLAETDNVRAALALVAAGEAPLGIVYATDAVAEPRVRVIGRFPADSHPPIVYPAAAVAGRAHGQTAAFLAYLAGPEGRAAFAAHGFLPAD